MAKLTIHRVESSRPLRDVRLEDRWDADADIAFLSGVQAIVRALLDQRRDDRRHGVRSAGFVSGYQGSPLGGLDKELLRLRSTLDELDITFEPGVNEELAATAVWGAQLAHQLPEARVDGVLGAWFGKNPGLDRAADAIRHATISGVGPAGGAVAIVGDDPGSKSSTLPSAADRTLSGLLLPVLSPASVEDVVSFGRHALRMSRAAGLWTALKVVADVADATTTVSFGDPWAPMERLVELEPTARLLGASSLEPERHLLEVRLPAALEYARRHALDRVVVETESDTLGLVAAGASYAELRRALADLGLGDDDLQRLGIRVLKIGMPWPLDDQLVRRFASGLSSVLVVEDKLPFLEEQIRSALYGRRDAPRVLGKRDAAGAPLLPSAGAVRADDIARALAAVLGHRLTAVPRARERLGELDRTPALAPLPVARTPFFCSGCPHSISTRADDDELVGAGIGCHVMLVQGGDRAGDVVGLTQMGGEGAQWIGMAPFTGRRHLTQNLGDGTFHHSGSLAVRAAVAAKVNMTYKLLYNDAVAMTGGQRVQGVMPVPELTRMLQAEGVARTIITTEDPARYRGAQLAANVEVRDRDELDAAAKELAAVDGVTVLIHDQMCAAERRRLRKRGKVPAPAERVWINERVCEGCGDCGEASGCLSVEPVQTEFGRKTQIHQASCNQDMTCLKGDCPSFLTVVPAARRKATIEPPADLPEPSQRRTGDTTIRMVGVGGTGVVTVAQVLSMAAHLEGLTPSGLDQTGLSQKGGPVVSDVRLATAAAADAAPRATAASVDVLLAFDALTAAEPKNLVVADPARTTAVVSDSEVPTGDMVLHTDVRFPHRERLLRRIERRSREVGCVVDARRVAELALGDHVPANMVLLGAAWQLGVIPVGWDALLRAVELNGTAIDTNVSALRWGRAAVAAPAAVAKLLGDAAPRPREPRIGVVAKVAALDLPGDLRELVVRRADDLHDWGGEKVTDRYLREIARVATAERERATGGGLQLTASVARQLHRLLAYKDEYEVARLHLLPEERARRERELGPGAKVVLHLHPPVLRALGMQRKLRLGRTAGPLLKVLRPMRVLRGTPLDPFGRHPVRRLERALPDEYLAVVERALASLTDATHAKAVALSEQAELIRGYEDIKLRNVEAWRRSVADGVAELASAS